MGRHAGIYRTGMMSQYGNPYAGQQQQVLGPGNRVHPPSVGYATDSRRPNGSSGNQPPRVAPSGYAPAGMHMAQPQQQIHAMPMVSAT